MDFCANDCLQMDFCKITFTNANGLLQKNISKRMFAKELCKRKFANGLLIISCCSLRSNTTLRKMLVLPNNEVCVEFGGENWIFQKRSAWKIAKSLFAKVHLQKSICKSTFAKVHLHLQNSICKSQFEKVHLPFEKVN